MYQLSEVIPLTEQEQILSDKVYSNLCYIAEAFDKNVNPSAYLKEIGYKFTSNENRDSFEISWRATGIPPIIFFYKNNQLHLNTTIIEGFGMNDYPDLDDKDWRYLSIVSKIYMIVKEFEESNGITNETLTEYEAELWKAIKNKSENNSKDSQTHPGIDFLLLELNEKASKIFIEQWNKYSQDNAMKLTTLSNEALIIEKLLKEYDCNTTLIECINAITNPNAINR